MFNFNWLITTVRVSMFIILGISVGGCQKTETVLEALNSKEATEALLLLTSKGIKSERVPYTGIKSSGSSNEKPEALWSIVVFQKQDILPAIKILSDMGIPAPASINLFDAFAPSGLIPSPHKEQIRFQSAIQQDLAATINKFAGIIEAKVYISAFHNLAQQEVIGSSKTPIKLKASVYIKHNGILDHPNCQLRSKIKRMVANSMVGLSYNDVTIVGDRSPSADKNILYGDTIESVSPVEEHTNILGVKLTTSTVYILQNIIIGFSILVLILLLVISWFLWKSSHIIQNNWKSLFNLFPFMVSGTPTTPPSASNTTDNKNQPATNIPAPISPPTKKSTPNKNEPATT